MTVAFTKEQIHEGLWIDLSECLCCEIEDIYPSATFFNDLGGESIELLDLSFRVRRRFGIEASFRELIEAWEFDETGKIAASTADRLRQKFPQIEWAERLAKIDPASPRDLLTVDLIEDILFNSQSATGEPGAARTTIVQPTPIDVRNDERDRHITPPDRSELSKRME